MGIAESVREVRKAPPTTAAEWVYFIILFLIAIVILLQPTGLPGMPQINPTNILNQPGWIGLTILLGSPSPLLLTGFIRWARSYTDSHPQTENHAESNQRENDTSEESDERQITEKQATE